MIEIEGVVKGVEAEKIAQVPRFGNRLASFSFFQTIGCQLDFSR